MKKKLFIAALAATTTMSLFTACGKTEEVATTQQETEAETTEVASEGSAEKSDEEKAKEVADLIDAIYVQERTDETDELCAKAKAAWDALTDAQKEMVEGENADEIGKNEILVVSFGTSFNDSRAEDISGIEKAIAEANPSWSVRRAFTAQIIINHVQARDGEKIDNVDQALERAVNNGVKNLVVQPTHLMHGAEYDELTAALDKYKDKLQNLFLEK